MSTKTPYVLKQTSSWKLQVYLNMYDLLVECVKGLTNVKICSDITIIVNKIHPQLVKIIDTAYNETNKRLIWPLYYRFS